MHINWIGPIAALSTFLGIWWGHVLVRKIEAASAHLWLPAGGAVLLGILLEAVALRARDPLLAAACGIAGVTCLWDAVEFYRQQKRVQKGHAPANPNNPRHAAILAKYPQAATLDRLAREPRGRPYSAEELSAWKAGGK
ncbi:MAG: DUF4491 family protein [Chloroflexota bacterium]